MSYEKFILPYDLIEAAKNAKTPIRGGSALPMYNTVDGKFPQQDLISIAPDRSQTTHLVSEIEYGDLKIFYDELDVKLKYLNPLVQWLFIKNAGMLGQLVRGVNYYTRSGFKGSGGSGNQLDAILLRAEQFQNPDAAGVAARVDWNRTILVPGSTLQYVCQPDALGANAHAALSLSGNPVGTNNEAIVILGFMNPAPTPCTSAFSIQYLGVNYNIQNLSFEKVNMEYGDSIIELAQPLFIWPNENALLQVRYNRAGVDQLEPIGLWIKIATNMRALATS